MITDSVQLTEEDRRWAEYHLCFGSALASNLTDEGFTEWKLLKLIKYELDTRKRKHILHRLTGRYSKLRRAREWDEIQFYLRRGRGLHQGREN